jgi:photosystem II stability/assembly factor-like uncharacterized protein
MRVVTGIIAAILTLSLGKGFVRAQTSDRWLYDLHMFDTQTGWAEGAKGRGGVFPMGAEPSIVRTSDGGVHWKDVTPQAPPGQQIGYNAFEIHPLTALRAWIRTSGGSQTADPGKPDSDVLFHTLNGGETWSSATIPWNSVPISPGSFGWFIDFINPRDGWLASGNDIYRSADGGKTWITVGSAKSPCRTQYTARSPIQSIAFLNATTGWITGYCDDGVGIYHLLTLDGGHTWQQQKLSLPPQLTRAAGALRIYQPSPGGPAIPRGPQFVTAQDGVFPVVYGTNQAAGAFFYVTHDGGMTWMYTASVTLTEERTAGGGLWSNYQSSTFADASHGWVTDGRALYVTRDGGRRWAKILPSLPFDRLLGEIDFVSPRVGWATGQASQIPFLLKTLDGGYTWTPVAYTVSLR